MMDKVRRRSAGPFSLEEVKEVRKILDWELYCEESMGMDMTRIKMLYDIIGKFNKCWDALSKPTEREILSGCFHNGNNTAAKDGSGTVTNKTEQTRTKRNKS